MRARKSTPKTADYNHGKSLTLPDGRTITQGQEFHVKGEGRFTFCYEWRPDGSVTAFGPVNSQQAQWRSFRADQVGTIHRTERKRGAA